METQKIQRMLTFDIKRDSTEEGTRKIAGRPIVYGAVADIGDFYEVIEQGALDETDMRDVPLVVNHNERMIPLARSRRNNGNSTMTLTPDDEGLTFEANIDVARNQEAQALDSALERGDIDGMSFVASVEYWWEGLGTGKPLRHITRIPRLFEISAVTDPAYKETSIAQRSADREALERALETLEREKAEQKALEDRKRAIALKIKLNT